MAFKSKMKTKTTRDADDPASRKPKGDAGLSRRAELRDHERGIGGPITYADDRHPMQAGPDHGPHK